MSDQLARVLAHPLRDRVLFEYRGDPASPSQVARRLGRPLNLVSYHTGVLARHGCLQLVRTERRRGTTEHFYRSTVDQAIEDEDWVRVPAPVRRALVLGTLDQLAGEARRAALDGGFDVERSHLTRLRLELDDDAVLAVAHTLRAALEELERIHASCRDRADGARRTYEVVMLGFEGSAPAAPDRVAGD
jgi:hypothetical protein